MFSILRQFLKKLKGRALLLRRDTYALWIAWRDPRVSCLPRIIVLLIVAYALSPIDLIPDFIPVLGYLDDLVILPLGLWLAIRMIPPQVMADARAKDDGQIKGLIRAGLWAAAIIITIWILIGIFLSLMAYALYHRH
jgi:uncharacterized membrane protein YkvA (DUF1232 family)